MWNSTTDKHLTGSAQQHGSALPIHVHPSIFPSLYHCHTGRLLYKLKYDGSIKKKNLHSETKDSQFLSCFLNHHMHMPYFDLWGSTLSLGLFSPLNFHFFRYILAILPGTITQLSYSRAQILFIACSLEGFNSSDSIFYYECKFLLDILLFEQVNIDIYTMNKLINNWLS